MALDTAAKRASVPGVGRPWMRGITPDATKPEAWRHSVGNTYAGFSFSAPVVGIPIVSVVAGITPIAPDATAPTKAFGAGALSISVEATKVEER